MRKLSFLDRVIEELDSYARFTSAPLNPSKKSPSSDTIDGKLSEVEKKHSAGLMRVDYTGEICAQGLYRGQASVAKSPQTKEHLYHAAAEEYDHLAWCGERLQELGARPSLLNPFWYWASFGIGAVAGSISDSLSYGFVVETEKQVMKHLDSHLKSLPMNDNRSREILKQMYIDESEHAVEAEKAGGKKLPKTVKAIMKLQSKVMTTLAYRF
ncbi:2-polyprenyl-3-methyl-6-methoxy-1,4-benzoquinone monooxygenase [Francisella tularensis subsp. novicida]|uniref:2-polyprenyl-3-methyl-6-methoxy-1,4-benzoquinone monooxygenase n=1 Tax=Francisella tularensis TaxID=263 RepID=UPI000508AD5A|nr:2-polyprenyl-3-methyl-6-methoxy-1,4-benzoquinone monooxygenase [Francisella tularensis]AJJ47202.1 ubiquinone biosynthesis COQ7 family protein [Francisella tularensis subsp. novicida]KFJ69905.1 2-nonaprenyl-3-methyl-6-methoxy-1,4-benzoquinol hydroxylase [Francisella tularensis subsp. novicida]MBK2109265.1 2-polyprenyl-3-methyl-6-methoxy-1,4-benzoquinone monooxygenase [Francisella tularensis subsp. novicida FSC595]MBK2344303.1 2-polyprenyl-3-methyl-6-methoxy-1,4-benzoquinone monooxygenase [Fra